MSQDQRKIPKESSFLQPKETKLPPSDDPTSPREMKRFRTSQEQQESPQDSSFLSTKETETSCSSVSPMNRDEEALKRSPDSAGNMGSQKYLERIQMILTPGYVNSSKNYKNNSTGQSYLGIEAFNNSVDVRTGMQQQISNSSVIDVHSGTWFANPDEDFQQANDKLQRLGMPGEGYGTNNPDIFGSGGNIASMSSQRDSVIPGMRHKMSNVSNNSMGGDVGMHAKSIDSGTWLANPDEDFQQANDKLQRLGMPGEGYTNNPVEWYNVSNSSISGSAGMNAKRSLTTTPRNPPHAYDNCQRSGTQGKDKEKTNMIPPPISSVKAPSWTITKKLKKNVVRNYQLYLRIASTSSHIRKHLSGADRGKHLTVNVYDHDMRTTHKLQLLCRENSCVLTCGWGKDFVQRRGLNEGDEIGLLWDKSAYRLQFGVISRANAKTPAEEKKLVIR